ncbi:hypothetical protein RRG08_006012 [Elysia crispata]|uniref:Uncharacterized protein n=1 Tax=Elysia crispata TaxID=231223 RepID=A0AAE1CMY8_9GAST|nr:hypothetical protein RRG08_006012 [Elysia crispata]
MAVYGLSHSVTLSTLKVYETPYMAVQPYSVQYDKCDGTVCGAFPVPAVASRTRTHPPTYLLPGSVTADRSPLTAPGMCMQRAALMPRRDELKQEFSSVE